MEPLLFGGNFKARIFWHVFPMGSPEFISFMLQKPYQTIARVANLPTEQPATATKVYLWRVPYSFSPSCCRSLIKLSQSSTEQPTTATKAYFWRVLFYWALHVHDAEALSKYHRLQTYPPEQLPHNLYRSLIKCGCVSPETYMMRNGPETDPAGMTTSPPDVQTPPTTSMCLNQECCKSRRTVSWPTPFFPPRRFKQTNRRGLRWCTSESPLGALNRIPDLWQHLHVRRLCLLCQVCTII